MKQRIIKNAKIVTPTEEFTGCMVVEGGRIRSNGAPRRQAVQRTGTVTGCCRAWSNCTLTISKNTWYRVLA